jgi:hypothetical protein
LLFLITTTRPNIHSLCFVALLLDPQSLAHRYATTTTVNDGNNIACGCTRAASEGSNIISL